MRNAVKGCTMVRVETEAVFPCRHRNAIRKLEFLCIHYYVTHEIIVSIGMFSIDSPLHPCGSFPRWGKRIYSDLGNLRPKVQFPSQSILPQSAIRLFEMPTQKSHYSLKYTASRGSGFPHTGIFFFISRAREFSSPVRRPFRFL